MKYLADVVGYVRSLLGFGDEVSRKRRADTDELYINSPSTKLRKVSLASQMSTTNEDWISLATSSRRTSFNNTSNARSPTSPTQRPKGSWVRPIDISDEDDDLIEIVNSNKPDSKYRRPDMNQSKVSSTPISRHSHNRSERLLTIDLTGQNEQRRILNGNSSWRTGPSPSAMANRDSFLTPNSGKSSYGSYKFKPSRNLTLGESCRLDEKQKYLKLLNAAAPNTSTSGTPMGKNNVDSFTKYSTPFRKQFTYGTSSRGKFLADLANGVDRKSTASIDLSNDTSEVVRNGGSTRNKILKVLDRFSSSEPVTIPDSEDEDDVKIVKVEDVAAVVEKQASSPRPHLEGSHALKELIDSVPAASPSWLSQFSENCKETVSKKMLEAQLHRMNRDRYKSVNMEIFTKTLEGQFERALKIKEVVIPIEEEEELVELNDDQNIVVDNALYPKPANQVLISKFGLSITRKDLQTLAGLNWLNDEVINFYISMMTDRSQEKSQMPKCYAFNTFFYPKLQKDGHSSLRRWTKKVDVFAKDVIVVPIHLGMHWCMAIIDFRTKTVDYYDSMGGDNRTCGHLLLQYLRDEHRDKKAGAAYDTSDWQSVIKKDIPLQMNGSDCGMFSCMFAEYVTRNAKITFDQRLMPYFRRKMVYEIVTGKLLQ